MHLSFRDVERFSLLTWTMTHIRTLQASRDRVLKPRLASRENRRGYRIQKSSNCCSPLEIDFFFRRSEGRASNLRYNGYGALLLPLIIQNRASIRDATRSYLNKLRTSSIAQSSLCSKSCFPLLSAHLKVRLHSPPFALTIAYTTTESTETRTASTCRPSAWESP
jgi:hypothetical protein